MPSAQPELEGLLAVHDQAGGIEAAVREIYDEHSPLVNQRFIICEDRSSDNSDEVLRQLAKSIPINLILGDDRNG